MTFLADLYAILTCFVLPVGLTLFLCLKHTDLLSRVAMGAAVYIVLELIIKLPLLATITSSEGVLAVFDQWPILYAILLGALEALFFTGITYLCFRFFFGFRDTDLDAFAYGLGFGGTQALLMVGMGALSLLLSGNSGALGFSMFLAGTEQLSLLLLSLSISLELMEAVQKKSRGLLAAGAGLLFLVHFLSYAALSIVHVPALLYEILLFVCMVLLAGKYLSRLPFQCPLRKKRAGKRKI